jgi:hypothetical protein
MLDQFPCGITEPDGYVMPINLQGTGAAAPTRLKGRNNYTVTRTSAGVLKFSFNDDPGPTFLGLAGFAFGNPTASIVLGWSVVAGAYTAPANATPASLVVTLGNSSFAAADLATTSTLTLLLAFKRLSSGV